MPCKHLGYRIIAISSTTPEPTNKRIYRNYERCRSAARREGSDYTVERVCSCPVPPIWDAAGWDAYRLRHGIIDR